MTGIGDALVVIGALAIGKPWGKHIMVAVIHDWLYREQKIPGWDDFNREDADDIFLKCMIESRHEFNRSKEEVGI